MDVFLFLCSNKYNNMKKLKTSETAMVKQKAPGLKQIELCADGKYRWIYEFNMLKNPTIFFTVLNIFGVIILIQVLFIVILELKDGSNLLDLLKSLVKKQGVEPTTLQSAFHLYSCVLGTIINDLALFSHIVSGFLERFLHNIAFPTCLFCLTQLVCGHFYKQL